jgi:hypothetical protein
MPVIQDELWKHPGNPGMIVVSAHAALNEEGRLFLDYGAGKEAIRRIPEIEVQCGQEIEARSEAGIYGFLPIRPPRPEDKVIGFGLFQTRVNWDEPADLELIRYSMDCLRAFAEQNNGLKIRMNFPGVTSGGLKVDQVAPLLIPLPSTVTVCHQGEVQPSIPSNFTGFKTLYLQVEHMLLEGRPNRAVEFLMNNGFDIQSAMDQVNAVQRCLRERQEHEANQVRRFRERADTQRRLF